MSLWKTPARITAVVLVVPLLGEIFVADWHWGPGGYLLLGGLVALWRASERRSRGRHGARLIPPPHKESPS